jgi:CheY-like chemotaxis protein
MAKRLGERLMEAGLVSAGAVDQALSHQKITGQRLGDCLVELGLVQEVSLLRFLASELKTRFVSAEKLAKAKIGPEVLERVPVRIAEAQDFLPIALDAERRILSVVMAEPQNQALVREIALVTEMKEVFAFVGVRSAIQAAIKKHYYGDPTAFSALQGPPASHRSSGDLPRLAGGSDGGLRGGDNRASGPSNSGRTSSRLNPTQLGDSLGVVRGAVAESDFIETLSVLVGLLEVPRQEFRGHSALVARQATLIARRLALQPREVAHTHIAAWLHDLGKRPDRHLTLPALAAQPELRAEAKRLLRAPVKLFETVHLPGGVNAILAQLYEAFDGSGVPQGVKGEEITAGARIIAAVDAFFDLTRNPFNSLGRVLPKAEALEALHQLGGKLLDPVVVDTLTTLQSGDLLRTRVENDGRQIVIADPDEAVRTDLQDALGKAGTVVQTVLKVDGVIDAVLAGEADTVAVGLAYGAGDIVALTQFVRARPECASVPILVLGDPTDPASKERLVQAGVSGFVALPLVPEEAAATIRSAYLDRVEHGGVGHVVHGGFDELAAIELLKLLGAHRKSGRLWVRNGGQEGFAQVERGRLIHAVFGDKKGEAALAAMLGLPQADFTYDPEALPQELPSVDQDLEVYVRGLSRAAAQS